jgi:hypothetical protein
MPNLDDELRRRMKGAGGRVDTDGLESRLHERRARKQITQKAGRGLLAVAVLTGSGFGIVGLNRAFRGNGETTLAVPPATNGPIVVSFGDDGGRTPTTPIGIPATIN